MKVITRDGPRAVSNHRILWIQWVNFWNWDQFWTMLGPKSTCRNVNDQIWSNSLKSKVFSKFDHIRSNFIPGFPLAFSLAKLSLSLKHMSISPKCTHGGYSSHWVQAIESTEQMNIKSTWNHNWLHKHKVFAQSFMCLSFCFVFLCFVSSRNNMTHFDELNFICCVIRTHSQLNFRNHF